MALQTSPATESPEPTSVILMPVDPKSGASPDLCEVLTQALASESEKLPGYHVVSYREVEGALSQEQVRQVAGCSAVSCAAEIAGALNTDQIVIGTLARVGDEHVLQLSRINARDASIAGRVMERVPAGRQTALLDNMPDVVRRLFKTGPVASPATASPAAPAPPTPVPPAKSPKASSWLPLGLRIGAAVIAPVSLLLLAGGVAIGGLVAATLIYDQTQRAPGAPHVVSGTLATLANVAVYVGGALVLLALPLAVTAAATFGVSFVVPK